ncbi:MAG: hypothetical protein AAGE94_18140, partial [Acidobacteriota bacterium]
MAPTIRTASLIVTVTTWLMTASSLGATPSVRPFTPQEYGGLDQIFAIAERADGPLLFATAG